MNGAPIVEGPTTHELLALARRRVERGWVLGGQYAAVDERGEPTDPEGPLARRWNIFGALYVRGAHRAYYSAQERLAAGLTRRGTTSQTLEVWQRSALRTEVLAAIDRAMGGVQ